MEFLLISEKGALAFLKNPDFWTPVIVALISSGTTFLVTRYKYRTEFSAERALRKILENEAYSKRSFKEIQKKFGNAFEDDELRRLLVRAGAVRFEKKENSEELWGLTKRNKKELE